MFNNKLKYSGSLRVKGLLTLVLTVFILAGCSNSSDPEPVNDTELITTVNVTFTNTQDGSDVVIASFQDIDGPGGNDGTTINPTLTANSTYRVEVAFLNESSTPTIDITSEVATEADEHQVFFEVGAGLNFTYTYSDQDLLGLPIGLVGSATTGNAGNGSLNVVLVHMPSKTATGVQQGDITNAGGDEDVRVIFTVTIQ